MVYPRISLDILGFLKPDFSAGPCCWSQSIRTRLWVIKSVLLHAPPWQLCQGKRWPTKGSLLLLARPSRLALRPLGGRLGRSRFLSTRLRCVVVIIVDASASAAAAVAAVAAAGGGGCSAGFLPGCVAFEDYLPCQRWADGAGPSGLVRSVTYSFIAPSHSMRRCLRRECHAGSERFSRT